MGNDGFAQNLNTYQQSEQGYCWWKCSEIKDLLKHTVPHKMGTPKTTGTQVKFWISADGHVRVQI
jgi:hypothetical protein